MKRGFTIVEIILSIGLIVLIGAVSLVSFNLIKKSDKERTLKGMSEEILTAVNVYVETNEEVKDELYENKNGLKIPLTTLENSGLVDFQDIELDDEKDFVVTMLGTTSEDDDHCASTYTAKSWDITSGEKIYICEKSDGTHNLAIINPNAVNNHTLVTNEKYYYNGYDPNNYIQLEGYDKKYRILYVDTDDTVVIISDSTFDASIFNSIKTNITTTTTTSVNLFCNENTNRMISSSIMSKSVSDSLSTKVDLNDIINSSECIKYSVPYEKSDHGENTYPFKIYGHSYTSDRYYTGSAWAYGYGFNKELYTAITWLVGNGNNCTSSSADGYVKLNCSNFSNYKLHLKSCMKIKSGTGDYATPYILENKCSG